MASVVTQDVSETGVSVECLDGPAIPLYRIVYFQVDRSARIAHATCRLRCAARTCSRRSSASATTASAPASPPSTGCGCWSNRRASPTVARRRRKRCPRRRGYEALLRFFHLATRVRGVGGLRELVDDAGERADGFFLLAGARVGAAEMHQHAVERQRRRCVPAQFRIDRDRAVVLPLRDLRFRHARAAPCANRCCCSPPCRSLPCSAARPRPCLPCAARIAAAWNRAAMPALRCSGARWPPRRTSAATPSSFSCSVGNVPGCGTGGGLPGAGGGIGTTGIS